MVKMSALPEKTTIKGLREMEEKDLDEVDALMTKYLERFNMTPMYSKEEVLHNLYSGRGEGEVGGDGIPGRRSRQVVWTYVVEVRERAGWQVTWLSTSICRTRIVVRSRTSSRSTRFLRPS